MAGSGDNDLANEYLKRQERMETKRRNFDRYWHEVAARVLPRLDDFIYQRTPGTRRDENLFDSTAVYALTSFSAAIESLLTPRSSKWHNIVPEDDKLLEDKPTKLWCEAVRDKLFRVRYRPRANFSGQTNELYMSLGAFGNGGLFTDEIIGEGIYYQNVPLAELYFEEDAYGRVDTVHRKYKKTVRQAMQKWGDAVPEAISKYAEKEPDREFEFLHVVCPNTDRKPGMKTYRGMKYCSHDIAVEGKTLMKTGGYRTMPYAISRYVLANREVYGRSPAMEALADIKSLNEMSKTGLRYGQLVTDPPWMTYDVDSLSPFSTGPGTINAGYLNERGEPLAKALAPEGDPRFSLEMMNQKRESINRAFLVTLFQILVDDKTRMTATEVMERAQEKGALLAPTMGRQQSDFLDPTIEREIDILASAGALPPMPNALRQSGGGIRARYDSPLSRAQRAEEGVGILRTFEAVAPMMQIDQSVAKRINFDKAVQILAEVNGAPAAIIYSDDEMAAINQQNQNAQQMQNILQAAPMVSETAKNLAQANQAAQTPQF